MSGYVTGLVLRHSRMKGAARMVLVVIADAARDDGSEAWPSLDTIADRAGITRRAAQSAIRTCEEEGELVIEAGKGGPVERDQRYRTHRYTIPIRGWEIASGDAARGEGDTPLRGEGGSPLEDSGVKSDASQGRNLTRFRGERRSPDTSLEPSIDTSVSDEDARRLCDLLADHLEARGCKRPNVTQTWIREMDRLIRIDGRDPASINRVLVWLDTGTDPVASFWRSNVRSPQKLRERWDQMAEQYRDKVHARRLQSLPGGVDAEPRKAWHEMTDEEYAQVYPTLSDSEKVEADDARRRFEVNRHRYDQASGS